MVHSDVPMKLYLLQRHTPIGYEQAVAFVVAAADEPGARLVAQAHAGSEGASPWRDEASCQEIAGASVYGTPFMVVRDYCGS
jgi:hypothetical protein